MADNPTLIPASSSTSTTIPNSGVTTAKIADLAVTTAKIADGAVDTTELADGAVTNAKIDTEVIDDSKIATNAAIAYSKLNLAGAIGDADIDTGAALTVSKLAPGTDGYVLKTVAGVAAWDLATASAGHTIQDEGVSLTQRTNLNFTGAGVTVTDSGGKTVVDVPAASSSTDASASTKGVTKLSTAPVSSSAPIAVGDNDTRMSAAAAGTASVRAIGVTSTTACAGNDARLSDTRTPTDVSVTDAKVATAAAIAESKLALLTQRNSLEAPTAMMPFHPSMCISGGVDVGLVNNGRGMRMIVPASGFLRDISVFVLVQGAGSPTMSLGVYPVPSSGTVFTASYRSGSYSVPADNSWSTKDPGVGALAVTAGDVLDFWVTCSSTSTKFAGTTEPSGNMATLPSNYPSGTRNASVASRFTVGNMSMHPLPSTTSEGGLGSGGGTAMFIMARISAT